LSVFRRAALGDRVAALFSSSLLKIYFTGCLLRFTIRTIPTIDVNPADPDRDRVKNYG
jgi:hypothetical protein